MRCTFVMILLYFKKNTFPAYLEYDGSGLNLLGCDKSPIQLAVVLSYEISGCIIFCWGVTHLGLQITKHFSHMHFQRSYNLL